MTPIKAKHPKMPQGWPANCPWPGTPAFDTLPWPDKVPLYEPEEFCRGCETAGTRHDLTGYREAAFLFDQRLDHISYSVLRRVLGEHFNWFGSVNEFSDEPSVSLETLAWVWEELLRRLGYRIDAEN